VGFFDLDRLRRSMSGFDKEAERERLREKYDRDQEEREATQRMSELLLKGATMTNSHCDACGDPIFRHDGRTFCPTCRTEGGAAEAGEKAQAEGETETDADAPTPDADRSTDAPDRSSPSRPDAGTDPSRSPSDAPGVGDLADRRGSGHGGEGATPDSPTESVGTARASLSRTLARYARAAEEADDPRRAEELLSAAREAAETLAALDTVR
jgi:uncharacterized Zn finger protein (UPF0148 family)